MNVKEMNCNNPLSLYRKLKINVYYMAYIYGSDNLTMYVKNVKKITPTQWVVERILLGISESDNGFGNE